jgi:outer membrane receptor for ferric coprogen and ferric-rhodotorulic acid
MGFIGVTFQPNDQWTYNADVRIVGQSWTSTTNSAASRLPAYAVVDVKAQYMWTPKTKTYVSITNLGDLHYVTYNTSTGVVGEPFVIIGGIQHSF